VSRYYINCVTLFAATLLNRLFSQCALFQEKVLVALLFVTSWDRGQTWRATRRADKLPEQLHFRCCYRTCWWSSSGTFHASGWHTGAQKLANSYASATSHAALPHTPKLGVNKPDCN